MERLKERKFFFAWNMEKEQKYLEEKAKQGYHLVRSGFGTYEFELGEPKDMVYQFDFRSLGKEGEEEYLELMQDWEMVQRYGSWYYFRKERDGVNDTIYSNVESQRKMYLRLMGLLALLGFPLYYQVLIFFPLIREEDTISTFYKYFMPIASILMLLHVYVMIKLLLRIRKLNSNIVE